MTLKSTGHNSALIFAVLYRLGAVGGAPAWKAFPLEIVASGCRVKLTYCCRADAPLDLNTYPEPLNLYG